MSRVVFDAEVRKHNALEVRTAGSINQKRKGGGNIPLLRDAPKDRAVWYETRNFGWILSPVKEGKGRQIIFQC